MRFFPSRHLLSSFSSLIAASAVSISSSFMIYTETIDKHDYNKTIDKHDYVIISGKRQGQLALEAEKEVLKRVKRGTKVLILTEDEIHNDEMNIQLSHSRGILRKVQRFYRKDTGEADIELSTDDRIIRSALGHNKDISYRKVLLFPGHGPITLSPAAIDLTSNDVLENVRVALPDSYDTVAREVLEKKKNHITIVGGSWAGLLLASELRILHTYNKKGTVIPLSFVTQEPHILSEVLPRYLCEAVHKRLRHMGVDLRAFSLIQYLGRGDKVIRDINDTTRGTIEVYTVSSFDSLQANSFATDSIVFTPHAESIPTDFSLCAGAGTPSLQARVAGINGLEVDLLRGAIAVNCELSASKDVFVAGNGASFPDPFFGRLRLTNSSDHTISSAILAASNMVTSCENHDTPLQRYKTPVPVEKFFLPGLGLAAVCIGKVTSKAETYGYFLRRHPQSGASLQPHQLGIVFSVADGKVIGALLWGCDSWRNGQSVLLSDEIKTPVLLSDEIKSPVKMVLENSSSALVLCSRLIAGNAVEDFLSNEKGSKEEIQPLLSVVANSVMHALTKGKGFENNNNFSMQWLAPRLSFGKINADVLGVATTYLEK
jgi:NADH dehydrogenase FAD-containing subunit